MPRDRSLDEFLSADDETEEDADESDPEPEETPGQTPDPDAGETAEEEPGDERAGAADEASSTDSEETADGETPVEPMATTYTWSPGGGECALCGEVVDVRWRDGEDLVCSGCKNW